MGKKVKIEKLHKEIDLIQSCISRMADNCFRLKEWYISLLAVVLTVLISQEFDAATICIFLLGITVVFWGLDAFYLKMETLFRWKYEWVISKRKLGEKQYLYDLNPHNKNMWLDIDKKNERLIYFVFNRTLLPLYGIVTVVAAIILVYNLKMK